MGVHLTCRTDTGHSQTFVNAVCFSYLREAYKGAMTKAKKVSMVDSSIGFDMEIGLGSGSTYFTHNNLARRRQIDKVFNELFGEFLDGKVIQVKDKRSGVNKKLIFIGSRCSTYQMIIASGIYRCWYDYRDFWKVWDSLEPYKLPTWVRLAIVSSCNLNDGQIALDKMLLRTNAQHMAIPSGILDRKVLSMFMNNKTPYDMPMTYMARETGVLPYEGRDKWLSDRTYNVYGKEKDNYSFIMDFNGADKQMKLFKSATSYRKASYSCNLHKIINTLIIPEFGGIAQ